MKESVGDRVREIRKEFDLNQIEFATRLGVDNSLISKIEKGVVDIMEDKINLICRTFNVSEIWLRNGIGNMLTDRTPNESDFIMLFRSVSPAIQKLAIEYLDLLVKQQKLILKSDFQWNNERTTDGIDL
ncbi:hypothetical protein FACS1894172_12710 [Spirochaetia bacterium]|nr:hypothetical protein FACS1894172_12710 [Spirochaetia bacterium]